MEGGGAFPPFVIGIFLRFFDLPFGHRKVLFIFD